MIVNVLLIGVLIGVIVGYQAHRFIHHRVKLASRKLREMNAKRQLKRYTK